MDIYKIYCLSYNNVERKRSMMSRFQKLDLNHMFYDGVGENDIRIHPLSYKRAWSCMYGHLDMIKLFVEDPDIEYGIFCEDDIYIHKNLKSLIPEIIADFKYLKLDVLLLGYLVQFKIEEYYNGFHLKDCDFKSNTGLKYHNFTDDIWGTQMYMLSKKQARNLLYKYDANSIYAIKTLNDANLTPFSADHIITKEGNRALISRCLAVENGDMSGYSDYGQKIFHKNCYDVHYDSERFI